MDQRRGEALRRAGRAAGPGRSGPCDGEGAVAAADGEIGEALAAEHAPGRGRCQLAQSPLPPSRGRDRPGRCRPGRRRSRRPAPRTDRPMSSRFSSGTASSRSAQPVAAGEARRARSSRRRAPTCGAARRRSGSGCRATSRWRRPVTGGIDQHPADARAGRRRSRCRAAAARSDRPGEAPAAGSAAPPGFRASGCRYGCGDKRAADSRAPPSAPGRRCPCGSASAKSCSVSSPNTEPSIRPTWTFEPRRRLEGVDLADDEAAAGSVFSQSRKARDQRRRSPAGRCRSIWRRSRPDGGGGR